MRVGGGCPDCWVRFTHVAHELPCSPVFDYCPRCPCDLLCVGVARLCCCLRGVAIGVVVGFLARSVRVLVGRVWRFWLRSLRGVVFGGWFPCGCSR